MVSFVWVLFGLVLVSPSYARPKRDPNETKKTVLMTKVRPKKTDDVSQMRPEKTTETEMRPKLNETCFEVSNLKMRPVCKKYETQTRPYTVPVDLYY
jgi:hypothetical protein